MNTARFSDAERAARRYRGARAALDDTLKLEGIEAAALEDLVSRNRWNRRAHERAR